MAPPQNPNSGSSVVKATTDATTEVTKRANRVTNTRVYTMAEVRANVEAGRIQFVFRGDVYDVTKWELNHPGGELVLQHMAGRDATQQICAYHPDEVLTQRIPNFKIGRLAEEDRQKSTLDKAFTELVEECKRRGLFDTRYSFYLLKMVIFMALWLLLVALVTKTSPGWTHTLICSFITAVLWHQVAFVAHDSGHNGITHTWSMDHGFGVFLASFVGGLSIAWWKASHNVHHIITNDPEHDPDIQHLPFFAACTRFKDNLWSTFYRRSMVYNSISHVIVRFQAALYYPILFFGRFNLYANSIRHVLIERVVPFRRLEIFGMACFWLWYGWLLTYQASLSHIVVFILISHGFTFILHVQITLSHYSMSFDKFEMDEDFVTQQLRTTLNVDCPQWLDWFHGGLQFQIEHHLFPRMPRHNLRAASQLVREFCKKHNLTYHLYTFTDGNIKTISHLRDVANQLQFLYKVASTEFNQFAQAK